MSEFKDDGSFRSAVQGVFNSLADQVDEVEFDAFEPRLTAGGIGIYFDDGAVVLLSQQTPTHEIWLSANYTAWHFLRRDGLWVERDTGETMTELLAKILSEKFQEKISFSL